MYSKQFNIVYWFLGHFTDNYCQKSRLTAITVNYPNQVSRGKKVISNFTGNEKGNSQFTKLIPFPTLNTREVAKMQEAEFISDEICIGNVGKLILRRTGYFEI